ncbi:MAG: GerMN domain-containing protein [Clostridium sp.]
MRKVIVGILIGISVFTVVGCGNEKVDTGQVGDKDIEEQEEIKGSETEKTDEIKKEDKVENKIEKRKVKLYLFGKDSLKEDIIEKQIKIEDKAIIKSLTEALKDKNLDKKYLKLPKEVEVKEAKIEDGVLTVDFSKDFIKEMPLGTATESGLIYMMINTYGHGVGVSKVRIKLNGDIYVGLGENVSKKGYFEIN